MAKEPIKLSRSGPRLAGWLAAGIAVIALAVWWSVGGSPAPTPAPLKPTPIAAAPTPASRASAAPAATQAPSFDIVRVNPQGGAVIAGRATPDSQVTVRQNGQVIGQAKTDAQGQFVVLPDKPLAPGGQELTLASKQPDQTEVKGDAPVLVVIPAAPLAPAKPPPPVVAVLTPKDAPPSLLQGGSAGADTKLALGVVDYDNRAAIRFSGLAPPGSRVRVYVDGVPEGDVLAGADGKWAMTLSAAVPAGTHTLRLDRLGADGKVLARAETPFRRAPESEIAVAEGQTVVVQPGESLWRIARRQYGQGVRYTEIFDANSSKIRDPALIYPGQVFRVPDNPAPAGAAPASPSSSNISR